MVVNGSEWKIDQNTSKAIWNLNGFKWFLSNRISPWELYTEIHLKFDIKAIRLQLDAEWIVEIHTKSMSYTIGGIRNGKFRLCNNEDQTADCVGLSVW